MLEDHLMHVAHDDEQILEADRHLRQRGCPRWSNSAADLWNDVDTLKVLYEQHQHGQAAAWFWTVRSYRHLNSGKCAFNGVLEAWLLASSWWHGELEALNGEQKRKSTYWAFTHLEILAPATACARLRLWGHRRDRHVFVMTPGPRP